MYAVKTPKPPTQTPTPTSTPTLLPINIESEDYINIFVHKVIV